MYIYIYLFMIKFNKYKYLKTKILFYNKRLKFNSKKYLKYSMLKNKFYNLQIYLNNKFQILLLNYLISKNLILKKKNIYLLKIFFNLNY
uniref:Uncharacterized protein n=1 Tax=Nephromyces sp. ex Molgula occidentalis TaxID=2544991 RepID=A0A5C1H8H8_9APIC|nr:hypothetical protein [Nephromyces sp. ex Molgula occidentalis]